MSATDSEDSGAGGLSPINLIDCGLEDLVTALLHGQPIAMPEGGPPFDLENDTARCIFAYYARRRDLWPRAKAVQTHEIEDVLKALEGAPPAKKATETEGNAENKFWTLRRVEAHRFGGLHRHCGLDGEDPEDFVVEVDRDVTLISGFNGAGKTALQNVIIWCLTGRALRSQHMPDEVHAPMDVYRAGGDEEDRASESALALPPVVPIPSAADLEVLNDQPKIDTWAKLTFHDEGSDNICVVQRALTVGARGKIGMTVTGLEDLGLPDLAIEAGTLMPGIAAHMRFDEKTTFADAIAQLTGLKPLEDLGRRSRRVVRRLRTTETQNTEAQASAKLDDFKSKRESIDDAWTAQPDLGEPADLISPDEQSEGDQYQKTIADTRKRLEVTKKTLESRAESVLGRALQLATKDEADALLRQLAAASDLLKSAALNALPSIVITKGLDPISDEDNGAAETLVEEMVARANEVSGRLYNKQEAARWQLYARVAAWHREHHSDADVENCPVCGTDLKKVPSDALLDKGVKEALRLCGEADADAAKGAEEWERDAAREFLERLPESLRAFANNAPTTELLQIYRKAFVEELLAERNFGGVLQPMKQNAAAVWELAISEHPLPPAPGLELSTWPEEFDNGTLAKRTANIERVIRLAKHRTGNKDAIKGMAKRYIGETGAPESEQPEAADADIQANSMPLRDQIEALRLCVTNAAPILSLLRQLDELETARKELATLNRRLARLGQAADAIEAFAVFENLVFQQVSGLISALDQGTRGWLQKIYSPHYRGGPAYSGFDASEEKGIGLQAGIGGMQVPAYKIMNASQLRACVWAFVFSLWERVRSRIGGLDCVLLDDPQNHFDPINADNLGAAIPKMPAHDMRPVITSNDYRFLAGVRDKLPNRSTLSPSWRALVMNPISSSRLTAGVSPDVEEIYERQKDWRADDNNEGKARKFVTSVRIYVENRLWNLLATDPMVMHKPTLADLIRALRAARTNGEHPFEEPPFAALLSHVALRDEASFYQIINKAHHRPQDVTPHEAGEVDESFNKIDRLLRSCSASYARFMGRLTREDRDLFLSDLPPAPAPALMPKELMQVVGDVSARSSADVLASGEAAEIFDLTGLGEIAFYGARSPGLSPLALRGQVVVVSLEMEAQDGDPVVALSRDKIYLRRLLADQRDPSRFILACDQTGTERVPPSLLLPRARTRLLPVIGVLYDQEHFAGKEEAIAIQGSRLLDRHLVAARVMDDSAYPVIRSGDLVLMEAVANLESDEVERLEDRIVVALTGDDSETFAYLKRLGRQTVTGIRILENVGWKGSALTVATREDTASSGIPPLQKLWRVHGTLRRPR